MYRTRVLALTLICAVTLRDHVGLLPSLVSCPSAFASSDVSSGAVSLPAEEEVCDDEVGWPTGDPDNTPFPGDNDELLGFLEFELESEEEEILFLDKMCASGSAVNQFSIETDRFLSDHREFFLPLICLRI